MQQHTRNLIGGQWVSADSGAEFAVRDPATDAVLATVPDCGADETGRAIDAASQALPAWRARTAGERGAWLRRLFELMTARADELARLLSSEGGKPLAEAKGEIAYGASFIDWAAEEGKRVYGETIPASSPHKRILVLPQPVGVAALITPWNFPCAMITRKLGPALAAGCTVVIKPAEQTPLSALALAALCQEAGLPAGVVNVVTGAPARIGAALLGDARVRKLSFTGSTETGQLLMRGGAQHLTRLSLELGGHAPFLVFDDADLDAAVQGLIASKFRNSGQTCICANRIFVQSGVYDAFGSRLLAAVAELKVGKGSEPGVQVGPLIDDAAVHKVEGQVRQALAAGAQVLYGGGRVRLDGCADRFYQPTVLADVKPDMLVCTQETFGPVLPLLKFGTEAEAVAVANATPYGLAAYFYSRDAARVWRVAEALDYGIVGANDALPSVAQAPFGGRKHSGFGREGGRHGVGEYLDLKYVSWGL